MDTDKHQPGIVLMGTGTSIGVPVVGCDCEVCSSENPRNHRKRAGVLVRAPEGEFVIDTGPELRLQLLESGATMIRAAIYTHAHADHIMGLDDLRIFAFRLEKERLRTLEQQAEEQGREFDADSTEVESDIPLYCEQAVEDSLRQTFQYAFADRAKQSHRYAAPRLKFVRISPGVPFDLLGQTVVPFRLHHGKLPILGFRIGNTALCTDVSTIPAESRDLLAGVENLVIDALRYEPHPTHLSVDQAVQWGRRLDAKRTILTHMSHELNYETLADELPDGAEPGWDGLKLNL